MTLWVQLIREENSSSQKQNKESSGAPVVSLSVQRELQDYWDFCLRDSETRKKGEDLPCLSCLTPGSEKGLGDLHLHLQELILQFSIRKTL